MNIAIIGAGITGAATAYELACDGHQVTVYERRAAVAEESSFAPTGWLSPALLNPWAAPGLALKVRQSMQGRQALMRCGSGVSLRELRWLLQWRTAGRTAQDWREFYHSSTPSNAPAALMGLERLAQYSQQLREALWKALEVDTEAQAGTLILLDSERELDSLQPIVALLAELGQKTQTLDHPQLQALEPSLASDTRFTAALRLANGASGNARLSAQILRQAAQDRGAHFAFGTHVQQLKPRHTGTSPQIDLHLAGHHNVATHDAVIIAAGTAAATLLQPLGLHLPVAHIGGYTVSASLRDPWRAPRHAVVDWRERLTITRQGQRIRIGAGAELGTGTAHHKPTLLRMFQRMNALFPGAANMSTGVQTWRGTRAMSTDGAPILGRAHIPGLWLNVAHGNNGAGLAHGCARVMADLIAGKTPAIDAAALQLDRYSAVWRKALKTAAR
jgi:D-amino-acid dehydrogenase